MTGRYIDSFTNDDLIGNDGSVQVADMLIDDIFTVDGQVAFNIPSFNLPGKDVEPTISVGATNIFNEDPPEALTANAFPFAARVHDPRGRVFYVRTGVKF